ncbi:MAG TPA: peptide ABC transporter substrate-binding protein [Gemmatimonadales bacterium]|jgi:peptide/nickel transport system substrate-binding protein
MHWFIPSRYHRAAGITGRIAALFVLAAPGAGAQRPAPNPTVVYAVGKEPTMPIPLFTHSEQANDDVSDQLFLHLAAYGPTGGVSGDHALIPALARSWRRVDPLTLIFELDPRARWQDGAPVTAHDVVYTWQLANNPVVGNDQSRLESIASVEAIGDRTVRVQFKRPSAEQVYTFAFLMQPLPSHLLERLAPEAITTSDYARHPIGDGPFRMARRVPGQLLELDADSTFFLGRPTISRVLFRYVEDPNARITLFLTGETDILDVIPEPAMAQVRGRADARLIAVPSNDLVSFVFNTRSSTDTTRPSPLFTDPRVRQALTLALDRTTIARSIFDTGATAPDAAQSAIWNWITPDVTPHPAADLTRARMLLAEAGWRDTRGDGVLVKDGVPLHFSLLYPSSSAMRHTAALQAQQMWRAAGAAVDLDRVEGPVFGARLPTGRWDVMINRVGEDPTPSSLVQSWSCGAARRPGSTNYARWCDSTFDRLVTTATTAKDQPAAWRAALARMAAQRPAIFFAASTTPIAVHRRFDNVIVWPSRTWLSLWQWRVRPADALPRDR